MDEFAQSRGDDDLFADEYEPVPEPVVRPAAHCDETARNILPNNGPAPGAIPSNLPQRPRGRGNANDRGRRKRGREGGHGRGEGQGEGRAAEGRGQEGQDRRAGGGQTGRGGGGAEPNGLAASQYATEAAPIVPEASKPTELQIEAQPSTPTTNDQVSPSPAPPSTEIPPTTQVEPTVITTETDKRTHAVRGDRSATGGPTHKKLTEDELTAKLEKMKILNAQKAERFRLSEADSAAFALKEKEMAQKRVAEQKATRHQDMERAKNRQRKLQAQGGREWDSEKVESDIVDGRGKGRSSEYVRGGHGGVIRGGLAGSHYSNATQDKPDAGQSSRGRGGFEGRGRGNRGGRGGRGGPSAAAIPTAEDFPSLPTSTKPTIPPPATDVNSPIDKGPADWAEEMATSVESKDIVV